jgi:hypothetical protein
VKQNFTPRNWSWDPGAKLSTRARNLWAGRPDDFMKASPGVCPKLFMWKLINNFNREKCSLKVCPESFEKPCPKVNNYPEVENSPNLVTMLVRDRPLVLGCQMACFQTKYTILGKFWRVFRWKMLVYFMANWYILGPSGIFYIFLVYFKVIWHILPVLVSCSKKSGKPAPVSAIHCWTAPPLRSKLDIGFCVTGVTTFQL